MIVPGLPAGVSKISKVGKMESKAAKVVHGNSKCSTRSQHVYEIYENQSGKVVKTGISSGKISKQGKSYRATKQVNKWNKSEGKDKYDSRVIQKIPSGKGARNKALDAEKENANKHRNELDPNKHKRP